MLTRKSALVATGATLVLAACGGSDRDTEIISPPAPPPPVTAVPDSAVASSTALVAYLKAQKTDDETTEPLTLPTVTVSVSETEEPQTL